MSKERSTGALFVGGVVVAVLLFVTFLAASTAVMLTVNDPPLLADPAPTDPPSLLCPVPSPTPSGALTTGGTSTDGGTATPEVTSTAETTSPSTNGTTAADQSTPSPSSPALGPSSAVSCAPDQVVLAPQYRGSYDPNTRLMALVAVVVPLLTTIVAFYFGQRAGAGEGEAEKMKVVAQVMATDPDNASPQVTSLKEQLKKANLA